MEQVENFECLGTTINSKGKIDMEINHRINKTSQTLIRKNEIKMLQKFD